MNWMPAWLLFSVNKWAGSEWAHFKLTFKMLIKYNWKGKSAVHTHAHNAPNSYKMIPGPSSISFFFFKGAIHAPCAQSSSKDTVKTLGPGWHSFPGMVWLRLSPAENELVWGGRGGHGPLKTWQQGPRAAEPPSGRLQVQRQPNCRRLGPGQHPHSGGFTQSWENKSQAEQVTEDAQALRRKEALPDESRF